MTYIEFFDKIASKNICSCLTCTPERVILIGDSTKQMEPHKKRYSRFFENRGQNIDFQCKSVPRGNLQAAVDALTKIVTTYDDCVFDITGGEEIYMLALGVVLEKHPDKNIQIHRFNFDNNNYCDCDMDGNTIYREPPMLTVEENIQIFGGDVVYGDVNGEDTYCWDLNREFLHDLDTIWGICKKDVRYWNTQISVWESANQIAETSEDGRMLRVSMAALERYLLRERVKYMAAHGIIQKLLKAGLIKKFDDETDDTLTISFKNPQIKRCLTIAGQALEMKVFVTAKDVLNTDGTPFYHDILNGVKIDWDGELHDEQKDDVVDTDNEVDVLLMYKTVPVFVSCKNGVVTSNELYKLNTVAERFGGKNARKVLVANSLDQMRDKGESVRQRAKDMGIQLIENIQNMNDTVLKQKIRNIVLD